MTNEQRLRELLSGAAADPGAKQAWPEFLKTARRHRAVHRARVAGGVALAVVVAIAAGAMMQQLPERERPRPADEKEQRVEREVRRGDVAELEERIRESQELVEDAGLLPGPPPSALNGTRPSVRGGNARGDERAADDSPPIAIEEDPDTALCRGRAATVVGTSGPDVLEGTGGFDVIAALGGDDTIRGGGGGDFLCGGDGIDHLFGDAGKDSLVGGTGDDALDGGADYDFVHFPGARQGVNVDFERHVSYGADEGEDVVRNVEGAEGTPLADNFTGDGAPNLFWGDAGADYFNTGGGGDYIWPGPGDDGVNGDAGSDTVGFHASGGSGGRGVDVDLGAQRAVGEGVDVIGFVENVHGTTADDFISGTADANALNGGFGDDTISGAGGDDVLTGAAGRDTLEGGPGHDRLDGGEDDDTCTSGEETTGCETTDPISTAAGVLVASALLLGSRRIGADGDPAPHRAAAALTPPKTAPALGGSGLAQHSFEHPQSPAVQLADPALGHAHVAADLLQLLLRVVVLEDDVPLAVGKLPYRRGDLVVVRLQHQVVERRAGGAVAEAVLEPRSHSGPRCLEVDRHHGLDHAARAVLGPPGKPRHLADAVAHRSPDPDGTVRLEPVAHLGPELVDRVHQALDAEAVEVGPVRGVDVTTESRGEELDERQVVADQGLTVPVRRVGPEIGPQLIHVDVRLMVVHPGLPAPISNTKQQAQPTLTAGVPGPHPPGGCIAPPSKGKLSLVLD